MCSHFVTSTQCRILAATQAVPSPQARHKVNCPQGRELWGITVLRNPLARCNGRHLTKLGGRYNIYLRRRCLSYTRANESCGTVIPQGTFSCPSGNSPCAAPCVDYTACAAVRKQLDAAKMRIHGREPKRVLRCEGIRTARVLYSLSSLNCRRAIPKGKREIHKRVETVGCYPLVPSAGSVHLPCEMVAMQQFLRSVRARLIQILTVQRLNRRILIKRRRRSIA